MKYAVLDTSFIISCIRNKIDFTEKIKFLGLKILIPIQVIREIDNLAKSGGKLKEEAEIAKKILNKNNEKEIDLHAKEVDSGLIDISKNDNYIIATLDREVKKKIKGKVLVIKGKKEIEII